MRVKMKKNNLNEDDLEYKGLYSQFITSYFSWLTSNEQSKKAKEMENLEKKKL